MSSCVHDRVCRIICSLQCNMYVVLRPAPHYPCCMHLQLFILDPCLRQCYPLHDAICTCRNDFAHTVFTLARLLLKIGRNWSESLTTSSSMARLVPLVHFLRARLHRRVVRSLLSNLPLLLPVNRKSHNLELCQMSQT